MKLKKAIFLLTAVLSVNFTTSAFAQNANKEKIDSLSKVIDQEFSTPEIFDQVSKEQIPDFAKLQQKATKKYGPIADRVMLSAIARYYYMKSYYKASTRGFVTDRTETVTNKYLPDFVKYKSELLKKYPDAIDARTLNADAWYVFWNSASKSDLASALIWVESAMQQAPEDFYYMDTKANILYKLGRNEEALKLQRKAASSGDEELQGNLKKMEASQPTWFVPEIMPNSN